MGLPDLARESHPPGVDSIVQPRARVTEFGLELLLQDSDVLEQFIHSRDHVALQR
jgi:hypothetical protein